MNTKTLCALACAGAFALSVQASTITYPLRAPFDDDTTSLKIGVYGVGHPNQFIEVKSSPAEIGDVYIVDSASVGFGDLQAQFLSGSWSDTFAIMRYNSLGEGHGFGVSLSRLYDFTQLFRPDIIRVEITSETSAFIQITGEFVGPNIKVPDTGNTSVMAAASLGLLAFLRRSRA